MLASVSISHATIQGSLTPRSDLSDTNQKNTDLETNAKDKIKSESSKLVKKATEDLTQQDQQKVQQLKNRDLEVKAHEQAHLSAAGSIAVGGARFTFTTGPNGVRYATGGEVSIDTSPIKGDPAATLKKADAIRRAALAPARPSSQDQRVASNANSMSEKARVDLIKLNQEQDKELKVSKESEESGEEDQVENETDDTNTSNTIEPPPTMGSLLDISV